MADGVPDKSVGDPWNDLPENLPNGLWPRSLPAGEHGIRAGGDPSLCRADHGDSGRDFGNGSREVTRPGIPELDFS